MFGGGGEGVHALRSCCRAPRHGPDTELSVCVLLLPYAGCRSRAGRR
jgi:hypothetical protein